MPETKKNLDEKMSDVLDIANEMAEKELGTPEGKPAPKKKATTTKKPAAKKPAAKPAAKKPAAPKKKGVKATDFKSNRGAMTWDEGAAKFMGHLKDIGKKDSTLYRYKMDLDILTAFGGNDTIIPKGVNASWVEQFAASDPVNKMPKTGKGKARPTIDRTLRVARQFIEWLVAQGAITNSPYPEKETKAAKSKLDTVVDTVSKAKKKGAEVDRKALAGVFPAKKPAAKKVARKSAIKAAGNKK